MYVTVPSSTALVVARSGDVHYKKHLKKNIDELEDTQKMALRICTRQWDLSYGDLLLNSKILTLAARREYLSLCTFYKIRYSSLQTYYISRSLRH